MVCARAWTGPRLGLLAGGPASRGCRPPLGCRPGGLGGFVLVWGAAAESSQQEGLHLRHFVPRAATLSGRWNPLRAAGTGCCWRVPGHPSNHGATIDRHRSRPPWSSASGAGGEAIAAAGRADGGELALRPDLGLGARTRELSRPVLVSRTSHCAWSWLSWGVRPTARNGMSSTGDRCARTGGSPEASFSVLPHFK